MSIYTTPLQFGYFFSLMVWVLLMIRGYRNQRLSDLLLGWVMLILAMELQDYTFGFSGINFLWEELNGFPRSVSLLFGPMVYFYFLAQTNRSFSFNRRHLVHFIPYLIYVTYKLLFFIQGPLSVERLHESTLDLVASYILRIAGMASFIYYLSKCMGIYRRYKEWSLQQFSNMDQIDFKWFRNFIYLMGFWLFFRELCVILDAFFGLDFYQDWWWNLALVAVAVYIGMAGFCQKQPGRILFEETGEILPDQREENYKELNQNDSPILAEKTALAQRLRSLMNQDRLYLQSELSLQELAQHLQVSPVLLSATINQIFNQNLNDYINSLRIEEFIKKYSEEQNRRYTMLSLAFDSGFNSKATFNRAFKKIKGISPQEFFKTKLSDQP